MDSSLFDLILLALAGLAAGFVNTLAGNGSVFTLSAMLFLGMDANLANGTNRVGVITQGVFSIFSLKETNKVPLPDQFRYIIPTSIGAIIGVFVVVEVDANVLQYVIGGVMALLLMLILTNAKHFSKTAQKLHKQPNRWVEFLLLLAVGFYGGFIQAGIGIMLLLTLTLVSHNLPLQANFLKLVVVFILTIPVLVIFAWKGQVVWGYGLTLAAGQGLGAWLAGRYAAKSPAAIALMRYLLMAMIIVSLIKIFFPWHLLS